MPSSSELYPYIVLIQKFLSPLLTFSIQFWHRNLFPSTVFRASKGVERTEARSGGTDRVGVPGKHLFGGRPETLESETKILFLKWHYRDTVVL